MDITVHDASVLNPLFQAEPTAVVCFGATQAAWNTTGAVDSAMTLLRYPPASGGGDRLASTHDSFTVAGPETGLEILGDEGAIVIGDAMTQRTAGSVHVHAGGRIRAIDVDTSRDLYQILLTAFASAMRGEGRPTVTGEEGLGALKVALAAGESVRNGRTVDLGDLR